MKNVKELVKYNTLFVLFLYIKTEGLIKWFVNLHEAWKLINVRIKRFLAVILCIIKVV